MGGLTPSRALLEAVLEEAGEVPVRVLIRCRGGGFEYSTEELDLMASEIRHLADLPLDGFVVGALRNGLPDLQALPAFRLAQSARRIAIGLTPACSKKARSSTAIRVSMSSGGISDSSSNQRSFETCCDGLG